MATVHIHNAYSDGHSSEHVVELPDPASLDPAALEEWWMDVVFPETGDGHGAARGLHSCYTATVRASAHAELVGVVTEWID